MGAEPEASRLSRQQLVRVRFLWILAGTKTIPRSSALAPAAAFFSDSGMLSPFLENRKLILALEKEVELVNPNSGLGVTPVQKRCACGGALKCC
jgi:hypothetical protein